MKWQGLYAITPDWPDSIRLLTACEKVIEVGVGALQLRRKSVPEEVIEQEAFALARLCAARDVPFIVVEQNRERVEALREKGVPAVCGDATTPEVLVQAHVARAAMLIVAIPDVIDVRRMVDTARLLNPGIAVVLRTHSEEEARLLREEQMGTVFFGEEELANGMAGYALARMTGKPGSSD